MTTNTPPDINQLQELAVAPPDISYLPQTWGWAVLAGLLVILAALTYWRRRMQWQRDLYRREALARLEFIEQHIEDPAQRPQTIRELPELLKRVALSICDEDSAASLRGERWQAFLQRHAGSPLPDDFATQLADLAYQPSERVTTPQLRELLKVSRKWIEAHHVAV